MSPKYGITRINGFIFKFYIAIKYLIPISQIKNICMGLDTAASPNYHISIYFLDAVDGSVEITYFDA